MHLLDSPLWDGCVDEFEVDDFAEPVVLEQEFEVQLFNLRVFLLESNQISAVESLLVQFQGGKLVLVDHQLTTADFLPLLDFTIHVDLWKFAIHFLIEVYALAVPDSIPELPLIPWAIGLSFMAYSIFHILFPLTIVDGAQFEVVVFPFALLDTGDPLPLVIVAIDKVHGAGAMR